MKIDELIKLYQDVYYIEDPSVIPLVCAVILSNKLPIDPIWLMLVGAPSSGKTELINAISGVKYVHQVSTLTENTLLSGMRTLKGQEPSLLKRIGNGVMTMKDFTTILAMQFDRQQVIVSQLREVYDGHFVKETGNGGKIEWRGHITFLGGVTEKIHSMEGRFAGMGKRELYYTMPLQNRYETTKKSIKNKAKIMGMRQKVKEAFTQYIEEMEDKVILPDKELSDELQDEIIRLSDFASTARSAVERAHNAKQNIVLVPSVDMPMRLANQVSSLATIFTIMNKGEMPDMYRKILYKVALDSIPKGRRLTLHALAAHEEATSPGIAMAMNYPTEPVTMWLQDLNALGLISRSKSGPKGGSNTWKINDEGRRIMANYDNVVNIGGMLDVDDWDIPKDEDWGSFENQDEK